MKVPGMNSPGKAFGKAGRSSVIDPFNDSNRSFNAGASDIGGANWHERLNMRFLSKVFTPDSPLFEKLG